jgi:hypothetical protein
MSYKSNTNSSWRNHVAKMLSSNISKFAKFVMEAESGWAKLINRVIWLIEWTEVRWTSYLLELPVNMLDSRLNVNCRLCRLQYSITARSLGAVQNDHAWKYAENGGITFLRKVGKAIISQKALIFRPKYFCFLTYQHLWKILNEMASALLIGLAS